MKIVLSISLLSLVLISVACNSQKKENSVFFVKYKVNNIAYSTSFITNDEYSSESTSDSTTSIRKFEQLSDSVIVDNEKANFSFQFYKKNGEKIRKLYS
ncbi:hypothetical protein [Pedobacter mucosus]|uniref:hypothetical protein n=1 Tax=Pedobacter mucosus TaxID=2895286 RepID=UPI001EE4C1E2|nr:hypothetical protein [Pedobacter mucosus]UKT65643.1 hypothetical protein LOK61_07585 [Pedobacter mucosus]